MIKLVRRKRIKLDKIPKFKIQHDLIGLPFSYSLFCGMCGLEIYPEDLSNMRCSSKTYGFCDLEIHGIVLIGDHKDQRVIGWDTLPKGV